MTDEERLRTRLHAVYEECGLDKDGVYLGREVCTRPCCYDGNQVGDEESEAVNKTLKEVYGDALDWYPYPFHTADYPSVENIVEMAKIRSCDHTMILKGSSSDLSCGPVDVFECTKCGKAEYRSSRRRDLL